MCKWFKKMNCYILVDGEENRNGDSIKNGDISRIEKSFRSYAAIFDRVKLVIKKEQAKENYLNYPHICNEQNHNGALVGLTTAMKDAQSEAIFIGSSEISEFPLTLLFKLVKNYNGEAFMGYVDKSDNRQPLFGIYNRRLNDKLDKTNAPGLSIKDLPGDDVKLLEIPEGISSACIGL